MSASPGVKVDPWFEAKGLEARSCSWFGSPLSSVFRFGFGFVFGVLGVRPSLHIEMGTMSLTNSRSIFMLSKILVGKVGGVMDTKIKFEENYNF